MLQDGSRSNSSSRMRARAASSRSTPASPSRTREPQCTCSHPETLNTAGAKQGPAVQVGQGGQPAGQAGAPAPQEPRRVRGDNLLHITHFFIQLKFKNKTVSASTGYSGDRQANGQLVGNGGTTNNNTNRYILMAGMPF